MKTDALITMLARGPVDADTRKPARLLSAMTLAGFLFALLAVLVILGPRSDMPAAVHLPMLWVKFLTPLSLGAALFYASLRLARPGGRANGAWFAVGMTLTVLWAGAVVDLLSIPAEQREQLVEGSSSWSCVATIALLAIPALIGLFGALRDLAPTQPALAGTAAGGLAGSIAALAYAVHCTEMALPFLAVWYMLGIAMSAIVGAVLGPRLLRW